MCIGMFVTLVPSYFVLCYNYLALGFAINIQVYYAFLRAFFTRYLLFTVLKLLEQSSGPSKVFFQCPRIISKEVDSKLNYMQVNFYIQATGLLSQLILHINFVKILAKVIRKSTVIVFTFTLRCKERK